MPKYSNNIETIDVEQFIPPFQIPKGVINVYEMGHGTEENPTWFTGEVWVSRNGNPKKERIKEGDWVAKDDACPNCFRIISNDYLQSKYKCKPDEQN